MLEVEIVIDNYSTGIVSEELREVLQDQLDIDIQVVEHRRERYGLDSEQQAAAERTKATERMLFGDEGDYSGEDDDEEESE